MTSRQSVATLAPSGYRLMAFDRLLDQGDRLVALTPTGLDRALRRLQRHGVLTVGKGEDLASPDWLAAAAEAVEHTPIPDAEWRPVIDILGLDTAAARVDASLASVRRYAAGNRPTPQAVAERLHVLALIIADLTGSYNDYGIRRWFDRPRHQLVGLAPADVLRGRWSPDDETVIAVRDLAAALVGLGAT